MNEHCKLNSKHWLQHYTEVLFCTLFCSYQQFHWIKHNVVRQKNEIKVVLLYKEQKKKTPQYQENCMKKNKTTDRLKDPTESTQEGSHYHRRRNSLILLPQIATTSWRAWNALKWNPTEATERKRGQWRLYEPRNMHLNWDTVMLSKCFGGNGMQIYRSWKK